MAATTIPGRRTKRARANQPARSEQAGTSLADPVSPADLENATSPTGGNELAVAAEVLPKRRRDGKLQGRSTGGEWTLTRELIDEAIPRIEGGLPAETVFQALGVRYATFRDWMTRGERGETEITAELVDRVGRAMAAGELDLADRWLRGDPAGVTWGPSRTAAEFLRSTHRRYGDKVRIQVETELSELIAILERRCLEAERPDILGLVLSDLADRDRH
jgi:hypothetical protein